MKRKISERHLVVLLFIVVLITFSFAHEDSKKIEQLYSGLKDNNSPNLTSLETKKATSRITVKTVQPVERMNDFRR
jgi:hypothetical protein